MGLRRSQERVQPSSPRLRRLRPAIYPEIEQFHQPRPIDLEMLERLIERTTNHDRHRPVGEHAIVELQAGHHAHPHAAFVARHRRGVVGYAHLSERQTNSGWRLEAFVLPEWRGRGIAEPLLRAVLGHVGIHGGGHVHAWAYRPGPAQERLARRLGMRLTRRLHRMRLTDPVEARALPDGYSLATFRFQDAEPWIAVHNETFASHPDAGNWHLSDLTWHMSEGWFDPKGFFLAWDAYGIAGYCWMKREGDVAWVYFLGVHPRAWGTGLGEALCRQAIAWAHANPPREVALYVDESNEAAMRLYRRLGFGVDHVDHCYEIDVAADPRLP